MEENVALDTTKQKKFIKSIKGIKKLIEKNENVNPEEDVIPKVEKQKIKRQRPERGLVYLSHIPHGFYENEMTQYFKQFGMVTNARVIRSKRTGNSKGFAFVEFKEPAVGEIVAETMNNYLMGKRLIKAAYIPPEKQKPRAMRKHWSRFNNPGRDARLKQKRKHNENKDEKGDLNRARKIISNINKTKKKLSELGISYDFFTPVDVPEALKDSLNGNENVDKDSNTKVDKKVKKEKASNTEIKDNKSKKDKVQEVQVKPEKNKKPVKGESKKESTVKVEEKKPDLTKNQNKKNKVTPEPVVNKKVQKQKQQKLNEAGVKSVENFIKVQEETGDSDSSLEFDSDEYEKMLEDESGDDSEVDEGSDGEDDEGSEDDDDDESDEEEEIVPPPKKSKGKPAPIVALPQKQGKKQKGPAPPQPKRKVPQKPMPAPVSPKKPKFEKQTQQPMKKHFKKKK